MGKNYNPGVAKAIKLAGGTHQKLADMLGCSAIAVRKMLLNQCTPERAIQISELLEVTKEEIRPDIFDRQNWLEQQRLAGKVPAPLILRTPRRVSCEAPAAERAGTTDADVAELLAAELEDCEILEQPLEVEIPIAPRPAAPSRPAIKNPADIARPGRRAGVQK